MSESAVRSERLEVQPFTRRALQGPDPAELSALTRQALDVVPEAVFILKPGGRVLALNRVARALLEHKVARLARGGNHRRLELSAEVIRRINAVAAGGPEPEPLEIERKSGSRLRVHVRRLEPSPSGEGRVAVVVQTLEHAPLPPAEQIAARFSLTPTEGRVAALLGAGHTVKSAARVLGSAPQTVRGHLKQIFAKTNTHRQADLVAKLLGR